METIKRVTVGWDKSSAVPPICFALREIRGGTSLRLSHLTATASIIAVMLVLACLATAGCGKKKLPVKAMHGNVTCGGKDVSIGQVTFVPIEGTPGFPTPAPIINGQYRVDARGGVPLGKHRVQVDARKKTGRKVQGFNGVEMGMIDEEVRMGPEIYAGEQSPLVVEVRADGDGRFDIKLPSE